MKTLKLIAVMLIGMMGMQNVNAQDTLIVQNGNVLNVRITKVTASEIYFNKWHDPDSATYIIEKNQLKSVHYMNGDVEILKYDSSALGSMNSVELFLAGQNDAKNQYHPKGTGTAVLLSTIFLTPAIGLLVAGGTSAERINLREINFVSAEPDYISGYLTAAKKIKKQKIWKNFAIGFAVDAAVFGLVALAASNMDMNMASYSGGNGGSLFSIRKAK